MTPTGRFFFGLLAGGLSLAPSSAANPRTTPTPPTLICPGIDLHPEADWVAAPEVSDEGLAYIYQEIALHWAKAMTRGGPKSETLGFGLPVILSVGDVFDALDSHNVALKFSASALRAIVQPAAGKAGFEIRVWLEGPRSPLIHMIPLRDAPTQFASERRLSVEFARAVQACLARNGVSTPTADAVIDEVQAFPWSYHVGVAASRLQRLVGRRLGAQREADLVSLSRERIDTLVRRHPYGAEAMLEKFATLSRLTRMSYGNDAELTAQREQVATRLRSLNVSSPTVQVAFLLSSGYETIFDTSMRFDEAWEPFKRALEIDDRLAEPFFYRAHRHLRDIERRSTSIESSEIESVISDFDRAIERNPAHLWSYAYKGRALALLSRWRSASAVFERAIGLRGDAPLVLYQLTLAKCWEWESLSSRAGTGSSQLASDQIRLDGEINDLLSRLEVSGIYPQSVKQLRDFNSRRSDPPAFKAGGVQDYARPVVIGEASAQADPRQADTLSRAPR